MTGDLPAVIDRNQGHDDQTIAAQPLDQLGLDLAAECGAVHSGHGGVVLYTFWANQHA
jgi:hypothetical protein